MVTRLLLFLSLVFMPLLSFAQERIVVTDPEIGFSYLLPDGWKIKDGTYAYQINSPEIANSYLSVTYVEMARGTDYLESLGETLSFEEDFDFEISYVLAEEYPNFKVDSKGSTTIDGVPAKWVKFQSTLDGEDMANIQYMFQQFNLTFKLTGTAPAAHFEKMQPHFTAIVQSFESKER